MTYRGKVTGGVVVLDADVKLPEGTVVTVIPAQLPQPERDAVTDPLYRIADYAEPTGIPDLALNIDHYLYGHPKSSHGG